MKNIVNCGLIGFGTVGGSVYRLLRENANLIKKRTGIEVRIKVICDLRIDDVTSVVSDVTVVDDWQKVVADDDIDVVIELIGGIEPAKKIIMESFASGKSVVTANKKLLAEEGNEIFTRANESTQQLRFEASVGGGIPCVLSLKTGLVSNRINSITGILNGTTNYILTRMSEENLSFENALRDAQEKGFAEADPTFDIEGFDAGHKISLLSMIAYNKRIDYRKIMIEGITAISQLDIQYAFEMGYVIKLLGVSTFVDGKVDIRVHPTMLPFRHQLASIRNEFNAILFNGDMTGPVLFSGKGAGDFPTASAVVGDVVQIAQMSGEAVKAIALFDDATYIDPEDCCSRYYIRIQSEDRSGVLTKISGVLAKYDISIASVIQKEVSSDIEAPSDSKIIPLIIMTHHSSCRGIRKAIKEINEFSFVDSDIILIRVEDQV